jgi:hypothetical protein
MKYLVQLPVRVIFQMIQPQKGAWTQEIRILKNMLGNEEGRIFFEYSIPRMGRRINVVLIIRNVIFVLEFKVGEKDFNQSAFGQVRDDALDMKNFHWASHRACQTN